MRYRIDTPYGEFRVGDVDLGWSLVRELTKEIPQGTRIASSRVEERRGEPSDEAPAPRPIR